jgi:hypothetical protein
MMRRLLILIALALTTTAASSAPAAENIAMKITSRAFDHNQPIPVKHTGDGDDKSPPLAFADVPGEAKSLALIVDDPDAPTPQPWVHWVLYNIPAGAGGLPEAEPRKPKLIEPAGAIQGVNSWPSDNLGYRGPAPPAGHGVHHYHFKLYALDAPLDLAPGATKDDLLAAMKNHVLAEAELVGAYERK